MLKLPKCTKAKPVYIQIADILKDKILRGELRDGDQLPGEYELAEQFSTSRVTLRKGLKILEDQQLLLQRHGIGAFVTYHTPPRHYRIAILEIAAKGEYGDTLLSELLPALSQHNECDFTVIKGKDTTVKMLTRKLQEHHCDGLIAIAPTGAIYRELCKPEFNTLPVVVIGRTQEKLSLAGRAIVAVHPDIVAHAVEYLYNLGHRRIAFFNFKCDSNPIIQERSMFFQKAAENHSLDIPRDYLLEDITAPYDMARARLKELMSSDCPPTAVLAMSPMFAFGAWQGAMELGLKIPEDLSILGLECNEAYNPHLSTIDQPLKKIAEEAVSIMLKTILSGKNLNKTPRLFSMEIIERGSCAPPSK